MRIRDCSSDVGSSVLGLGVPYSPGDRAVDAKAVGEALAATLDARDAMLADSRFAMELGRWLVAEAGVYLTRIVDRKTSHGETFLVTDGGLHHQLAASGNFGTVIRRNYPIRSEEHTSELQSLMRITYAAF